MKKFSIKKYLTSSRLIVLGFLGLILLGSILLVLPFSSADMKSCNYLEALFTSVSAVCVTGLVVVDTATQWSFFGQFVILLMIQIGGMGVMMVGILLAVIAGKKIGLSQRSAMQETLAAYHLSGIVKLTKFIFIGIFSFEIAGALLMSPIFIGDFGFWKGVWYSIFHSVSAFCNAGFDLMGRDAPFSSLTGYASNPFLNIIVMILIFVGGLGFLTWDDIKNHGIHIKKYHSQSKMILMFSLFLISIPAIFFFFAEFSELPLGERFLSSIFQSVTTRTAGFNTQDLASMTESGQFLMILLMLVGGSPGSTAGGMKITTIAVLIFTLFGVFRRQEDTTAFRRRIANRVVKQAVTLFVLYLFVFVLAGITISTIESLPMITCLFESASAIATVGLTLGITPNLTIASKIILMFLMFFGRIGGLTLISATVSGLKHNISRLPEDKITVG